MGGLLGAGARGLGAGALGLGAGALGLAAGALGLGAGVLGVQAANSARHMTKLRVIATIFLVFLISTYPP